MPAGRKKILRQLCIDPQQLICSCVGPLKLSEQQLQQLEQVPLFPDELQALAYKDIEHLTMQQAAKNMGISKTVFAGIYTTARQKQTDCLINGKILLIQCDQ